MLPAVFISHSSREGALARLVIASLQDRLAGTVEVLLDEVRLRGGDHWRDELWKWWSTCDAAVIVCSAEALQSDWVLVETAVLKRRAEKDRNFRLLPLRIDPVTVDQIRSSRLNAHLLTEVQTMPVVTAKSVNRVVDEIVDQLQPLAALDPAGRPLYPWERRIAALAEPAVGDDQLLDDLRRLLPAMIPAWPDAVRLQSRLFARELLECADRNMREDAVRALAYRVEKEDRRAIVDLVVPAQITAEETRELREILQRAPGDRAVALGTSTATIGHFWITRASACFPVWERVECKRAKGARPKTAMLDAVYAELAARCNCDETDFEAMDARLRRREDKGEPIFLLMPVAGIENDLRDILKTIYAQVRPACFLLFTRGEAEGFGPPIIPVELTREHDLLDEHAAGPS